LLVLKKIDNLYLSKGNIALTASSYGNSNQNAFTSVKSTLPSYTTLLDNKSLFKYLDYTLGLNLSKDPVSKSSTTASHSLSFLTKPDSYNERIVSSIPFDLFFLKKFSSFLNSYDLKNITSTKDKLNVLNITNKTSSSINFNKFSSSKNGGMNILDELISSNINAYNT
jgi:hypothetical protein